jgi:hypothetical protein
MERETGVEPATSTLARSLHGRGDMGFQLVKVCLGGPKCRDVKPKWGEKWGERDPKVG